MARLKSTGKCRFCMGTYSKGGMSRHLQACAERKEADAAVLKDPDWDVKRARMIHLGVVATYLPMYWMHLEMPAAATLQDLDNFLRDEWLECCGHLSAFKIGDTYYTDQHIDIDWMEGDIKDKLDSMVEIGMTFEYEYDFGSTTELTLKVIDVHDGVNLEDRISIMANNDLPEWECSVCGKPATELCLECGYDDTGDLCDSCAQKHEHDEMLVPIVNSPRTGVCGYVGKAGLDFEVSG